MSRDRPSVTVAVPTYNRAGSLRRAIDSVLAQTHADLELVISDNASTDETPAVCAGAAQADTRVRFVRQPTNQGLTANFNAVLREARGTYVMVLADDDWLEPDYVANCLGALRDQPDVAVASGSARYYREGVEVAGGKDIALLDPEPERRVVRYFAIVRDNASIYGLMRREAVWDVLPMRNALAGDWLLIARMAMTGKVLTVPETWINRSAEGASASFERTVRSMGLTRLESRHPHLAIAAFAFADVARDSPAYAHLSRMRRMRLGLACWWAVLRHRPFNVIEDALAPYLRRRHLRWIDRALRPIVQRIQR